MDKEYLRISYNSKFEKSHITYKYENYSTNYHLTLFTKQNVLIQV